MCWCCTQNGVLSVREQRPSERVAFLLNGLTTFSLFSSSSKRDCYFLWSVLALTYLTHALRIRSAASPRSYMVRGRRKRMASNAARLFSVEGGRTLAAKDIDLMWHKDKMGGVTTRRIVAYHMIQFGHGCFLSARKSLNHSGVQYAVYTFNSPAKPHMAVTFTRRPGPYPASGGRRNLNFPENPSQFFSGKMVNGQIFLFRHDLEAFLSDCVSGRCFRHRPGLSIISPTECFL
jgi:hypothetical protein